ncbi:glycosyltransferase [Actinokineospora sp. NBRC 105648]|uniref:glycosyltransferase n=1 Tax=Actinokineospora sp. NBRC 105648 TaxID=3032206 RepID=UPI0024A10F9E|nr:glycosyltransferase [Actinokineospora sp. NBRC 105648]GLZ43269.1 glycosyl transferase [Actinokineospora sp. NBRC 105648]
MRVLVASTEGAGHVGPLVPVADAFARCGHEVLFFGPPRLAGRVGGHALRAGPESPPSAEFRARLDNASPAEAAVLVGREYWGRLCTALMLPVLEDLCREWRPDLVLRETCEYPSAIAAERLGVRHAQVAISAAAVEETSLRIAEPALEPYSAGIVERVRQAPYLTRFPPSLDPSPFPITIRFHEGEHAQPSRSATTDSEDGQPPPGGRGGGAGEVYVTFGSVAGGLPIGRRVFGTAVAAVAGLPALITTGHGGPDLGPLPPRVRVAAWVPQAEALAPAAVVVCHGGSGTVFGALAAGVPLVVVPLFADNPVNAQLVADAGAGLVVAPDADPATLRAAIDAVLGTPSYRTAAGRVAAEMRALPGVDQLPGLLSGSHGTWPGSAGAGSAGGRRTG